MKAIRPENDVEVFGDDTPDLRAIYEAQFDSLLALARLLVGESGLAEELVQDTFARLLERPPKLNNADALDAYVRSAVLNACRSKIRRLVLERRHATPSPTSTTDTTADHALRAALLELPIRQRQCVALRYYEDRTVADIADLLDISDGSVKTHLHRGLSRLKDLIEDES